DVHDRRAEVHVDRTKEVQVVVESIGKYVTDVTYLCAVSNTVCCKSVSSLKCHIKHLLSQSESARAGPGWCWAFARWGVDCYRSSPPTCAETRRLRQTCKGVRGSRPCARRLGWGAPLFPVGQGRRP